MAARRVVIPDHKCDPNKSSCIGQVKTTTGKKHFKCPKEEKPTVPECLFSHERGYVCSVSDLELTDLEGEIICPHSCAGCKWVGMVFDEVKYDQGFVPGWYLKQTPLPKRNHGGKQKRHIPPADTLRDLGCKGIIIDKEIDSNKFEDIATFEFEGESHKIIPIGNDLYDIGCDKFWLYHKYDNITTHEKHSPQHYHDEGKAHVCCFIDKETMKTYVVPSKSVNIFGFQFQRGVLYRYIKSTNLRLADSDVFKDNTKFIATSVCETNRNDVTNKDEDTWGYLVINDKFDEFIALTKRATRIFANEDYSGIGTYNKSELWDWKHRSTERTILEVIEDDEIYQKYKELIKLDNFFEGKITGFDLLNPKEELERRQNELRSQDCSLYLFGELMIEGFNPSLTEFDPPWEQTIFDEITYLYNLVNEFINKYCQRFSGETEDVLYHLYCDAVDPNNVEFTRWLDDFNGGKENMEYYKYSNRDIVQACKTKHVLNLVHLSSPQNIEAVEELFMLGIQHPSYGNPLKARKAQEVAFDFINPYDEDDEDSDFTIYDNIPQLLKEDPDINTVSLFGPKPLDLWSDKDHKRAAKGEPVKEIRTIVMGTNAKENDPITNHCISWIKNGKYIPLPLKNISVSGSRVLPVDLRTKYVKRDENYGSGYFSPAVHVWKGYYIREGVQLVYARIAPGSDCSAITAALEINEELANRLKTGVITPEEYEKQSIKIVALLHNWYASATFKNKGLMSILHKVLYYGGYVLCNEPYRKHNKTEVKYPETNMVVDGVVGAVPVTVSNYEVLSLRLFDRRELRYCGEKRYGYRRMFGAEQKKRHIHNPRFTYFTRNLERTNKLLTELGDELVTLCRSEYSGTTNTINLALEAGKKVIEITSPKFEFRDPKEDNDDPETKDVPFLDYAGENDPIQKGRSIPKRYPKREEIKKEIKLSYKEIKWVNIYYPVVKQVPTTISNYMMWDKKVNLLIKDYRVRLGIPYIPMARYTGTETLNDYIDSSRYNLAKLFD